MPKKQAPKMDPSSPLSTGHRWVWVPVLVATGINIAFQVAFHFLVVA